MKRYEEDFAEVAAVSAEVPREDGLKSRARDLRDPFEWLESAGVAYRVWNVSKPSLPLDFHRNHIFKLFGVDVGLLGAQTRIDPGTVIDGSRIFTEFKGAMAEQYVQQEGLLNIPLYAIGDALFFGIIRA